MRQMRYLVAFALCFGGFASASPFIPGKPQERPIALVGGVVHPVDGPAIEGGVVLFDQGKIVAVGKDVAIPHEAEKIDCAGKHVYPGLIDAFTGIGLLEIEAVRATADRIETGRLNPNASALVAVNPDSEIIPVARANGVLTALTAPSGGLISGTAAVISLDGWTYEDMAVKPAAGIIVNIPRAVPPRLFAPTFREEAPPPRRDRELKDLQEAFADARAYLQAKQAAGKPGSREPRFDARCEAMIPLLVRSLPLIAAADDVQQIQDAVAIAQREQVDLIVLGGYDAPLCADLLKKHNVSVIVAGVNRLPQRRDDDYDAAFTLPARLKEAGIRFCISGNEQLGNERNLPYHAGLAAAHGLERDDAIRSITLAPAEILGVSDRLGSLTAGKDATILISSGDILEIPSRIERAFIQGRAVDLTDKQKLLWEKYKEKQRRK